MADKLQHREHRLYQQMVLPLAPLTLCEVAGIPPSAAWKPVSLKTITGLFVRSPPATVGTEDA
jgi:hypothetical protein